MYPYQQDIARRWGIAGVLVCFAATMARFLGPGCAALAYVVSSAICMKAIYHLAVAKGRDPFFALLGLLSFPGLAIASFLRDHHPELEAESGDAGT